MLELRYGTKVIEFAKGKTSIIVGNWSDLIPTLELLKQAVQVGEFDDQLSATASQLAKQLIAKKKSK